MSDAVWGDKDARKNNRHRIFPGRAQHSGGEGQEYTQRLPRYTVTCAVVELITNYGIMCSDLELNFLVWFSFSKKLLYFIFPCHHSIEFKTLDHISAPLSCISGLHTPSRKEWCYLTERIIFNNWIYLGHVKLCSGPHMNMQLSEWFIHHPAGCVHIFFQHII